MFMKMVYVTVRYMVKLNVISSGGIKLKANQLS